MLSRPARRAQQARPPGFQRAATPGAAVVVGRRIRMVATTPSSHRPSLLSTRQAGKEAFKEGSGQFRVHAELGMSPIVPATLSGHAPPSTGVGSSNPPILGDTRSNSPEHPVRV